MVFSEKIATFANVNELKRHIEILLLSNDCVIVPEFGGFMAHHVDVRYDGRDNMFLPPLRTIGFNKVSDKCVEVLFAKEGESVENAKKRLSGKDSENK